MTFQPSGGAMAHSQQQQFFRHIPQAVPSVDALSPLDSYAATIGGDHSWAPCIRMGCAAEEFRPSPAEVSASADSPPESSGSGDTQSPSLPPPCPLCSRDDSQTRHQHVVGYSVSGSGHTSVKASAHQIDQALHHTDPFASGDGTHCHVWQPQRRGRGFPATAAFVPLGGGPVPVDPIPSEGQHAQMPSGGTVVVHPQQRDGGERTSPSMFATRGGGFVAGRSNTAGRMNASADVCMPEEFEHLTDDPVDLNADHLGTAICNKLADGQAFSSGLSSQLTTEVPEDSSWGTIYHEVEESSAFPGLPTPPRCESRAAVPRPLGVPPPVSTLTLSSPTALLSSAPEWQAQFYKTKLCPFFVRDIPDAAAAAQFGVNVGNATGVCTNGTNCRFAHAINELRPLPDLRKTKLCSSYTRRVPCKNPRCPFAHSPQELRTSSSVFYKVTLCNFYKNGRCWNGANCRFAHGSEELRSAVVADPGSGGWKAIAVASDEELVVAATSEYGGPYSSADFLTNGPTGLRMAAARGPPSAVSSRGLVVGLAGSDRWERSRHMAKAVPGSAPFERCKPRSKSPAVALAAGLAGSNTSLSATNGGGAVMGRVAPISVPAVPTATADGVAGLLPTPQNVPPPPEAAAHDGRSNSKTRRSRVGVARGPNVGNGGECCGGNISGAPPWNEADRVPYQGLQQLPSLGFPQAEVESSSRDQDPASMSQVTSFDSTSPPNVEVTQKSNAGVAEEQSQQQSQSEKTLETTAVRFTRPVATTATADSSVGEAVPLASVMGEPAPLMSISRPADPVGSPQSSVAVSISPPLPQCTEPGSVLPPLAVVDTTGRAALTTRAESQAAVNAAAVAAAEAVANLASHLQQHRQVVDASNQATVGNTGTPPDTRPPMTSGADAPQLLQPATSATDTSLLVQIQVNPQQSYQHQAPALATPQLPLQAALPSQPEVSLPSQSPAALEVPGLPPTMSASPPSHFAPSTTARAADCLPSTDELIAQLSAVIQEGTATTVAEGPAPPMATVVNPVVHDPSSHPVASGSVPPLQPQRPQLQQQPLSSSGHQVDSQLLERCLAAAVATVAHAVAGRSSNNKNQSPSSPAPAITVPSPLLTQHAETSAPQTGPTTGQLLAQLVAEGAVRANAAISSSPPPGFTPMELLPQPAAVGPPGAFTQSGISARTVSQQQQQSIEAFREIFDRLDSAAAAASGATAPPYINAPSAAPPGMLPAGTAGIASSMCQITMSSGAGSENCNRPDSAFPSATSIESFTRNQMIDSAAAEAGSLDSCPSVPQLQAACNNVFSNSSASGLATQSLLEDPQAILSLLLSGSSVSSSLAGPGTSPPQPQQLPSQSNGGQSTAPSSLTETPILLTSKPTRPQPGLVGLSDTTSAALVSTALPNSSVAVPRQIFTALADNLLLPRQSSTVPTAAPPTSVPSMHHNATGLNAQAPPPSGAATGPTTGNSADTPSPLQSPNSASAGSVPVGHRLPQPAIEMPVGVQPSGAQQAEQQVNTAAVTAAGIPSRQSMDSIRMDNCVTDKEAVIGPGQSGANGNNDEAIKILIKLLNGMSDAGMPSC